MVTSLSSVVIPIADEGDIGVAMVQVGEAADRAGFSPADRARVMTAASELATNIRKFAGRGTLRVSVFVERARTGLEVVAEDPGPGIADVEAALTDHVSTAGTLGLGLPGVRRLMDEFELRTTVGTGTRVRVRKWRP